MNKPSNLSKVAEVIESLETQVHNFRMNDEPWEDLPQYAAPVYLLLTELGPHCKRTWVFLHEVTSCYIASELLAEVEQMIERRFERLERTPTSTTPQSRKLRAKVSENALRRAKREGSYPLPVPYIE